MEFNSFKKWAGILAGQYGPMILFFAGLILLWEIATSALDLIPSYILPPPSEIVAEIFKLFPRLLFHTKVTLIEILIGFLLGILSGLGLAVATIYSKFFEKVIYPTAIFTQTVPKIAIAPLFILWFGFGYLPKIVITALICLFPIFINAVIGLRSIDPKLLDLMYSLSATRWQVFKKIRAPNSMPYIFAGLKIGITLAVVGAIVGEWVGSDAGLGYVILLANSLLQTNLLFAALVMISLLGVLLFFMVVGLEKLISPRQQKAKRVEGLI